MIEHDLCFVIFESTQSAGVCVSVDNSHEKRHLDIFPFFSNVLFHSNDDDCEKKYRRVEISLWPCCCFAGFTLKRDISTKFAEIHICFTSIDSFSL